MSSFAPSPSIRAKPDLNGQSSLFTVRLIRAISQLIDRHGWFACAAVSIVCGWLRLNNLRSRPLDHDELYTFYIAQAPTLKGLLELTRTVDLHPPLSYLLIRASFAVFGVSSWSCRLPSVLAFIVAIALIFWLVQRILSPLYGIVAILFLWSVPLTYQADEARPYSLLLCFTSVMLAAWYLATETNHDGLTADHRRFALMTLTAGGFGLLLSHVLGVLPYAAFCAAELVRLSIRRKADWKLWAALSAPAVCGLTYLPLFRSHAAILFTDEYRPTPMRMFNFYCRSICFLAIPLTILVLLALLWPYLRRSTSLDRRQIQTTPQIRISGPLLLLLCSFAAVPIAVGILFARTGTAFFDRYGIVILIPIAILPALLLAVRTGRNQMSAAVVILALSGAFFFNTAGKVWLIEQLGNFAPPTITTLVLHALFLPPILTEPVKPIVPLRLQTALIAAPSISDLASVEPDLPLVANTGLTFLEIDRKGDVALTKRLYLLDDRQAATAISHDTVFENYDRLKKVFPIRGQIEAYCAFIGEHPHFLALGAYNHPQGWLLKKLDMDGAGLRIIGTYAGITEEAQLYDVTVGNAVCPAVR